MIKTINRITKTAITLFTIVSFLFTNLSFAQQEEKIIITFGVRDNRAVSEATILSKIKLKPGDKFSQDILNDDLKRLYALGYFTDVSMDVEDYKEGVMITIIVEEKPLVEEVIFEGNRKISTRQLRKVIETKSQEMLNYSKLSRDINELKAFYSQYGFQKVKIKYEIQMNNQTNTAEVRILIDEKQRIRIKNIYVEGNESVPAKTILSMMKTRPAWIFRRGYFDEEALEADIEKIKRYYQNLGFLDVGATSDFRYDEENKLMFITLRIDEGKRYITGKITISGNIVFPKEDIENRILTAEGDSFSYERLRRDTDSIREYYYQMGYMNVELYVDRKIDAETNRIDLDYGIDANEVVYVGRIDIKGNTNR